MSYILDALKKADAERERGGIPGLHSQPQAPVADDEEVKARRGTLPIVWIGAGVAISLIGVLSWQLLARRPAASDIAPAAPQAPVLAEAPRATTEAAGAQQVPPAATTSETTTVPAGNEAAELRMSVPQPGGNRPGQRNDAAAMNGQAASPSHEPPRRAPARKPCPGRGLPA